MKIGGKRGTHVELVISFTIFILFVIAIFLLIQPILNEKENKKPILDLIEEGIIKNISSNMTITLIKIISSPSGECIQINGANIWGSGEKIVVKNIGGKILNSSFNYPLLEILWLGNKSLKIYSSLENFENFSFSPSSCTSLIEGTDFSINSIKTEEYIFESNLEELKNAYNSGYQELKSNLDISSEEEFGFSFIDSKGLLSIDIGNEPRSKNIYSKEVPVIYVDNQSNIATGIIRIKAW